MLADRTISLIRSKRLITLGVAFLLFFGSLVVIPFMGSSFIPSVDTGELSVVADLDAGLSLDVAGGMAVKMEDVVREYPEVLKIYSSTDRDSVSIFVKTVGKGQRERSISEIASDMRIKLSNIPGVKASVNLTGGIETGSEKQVQFRLLGEDLDVLQGYAEEAQRIMESIPGTVDVSSSFMAGKPEGKIEINRAAATDLGISTAQVADTLSTLFNGVVVSQFEEGEDRFDVRLRLAADQRKNMGDLSNIYLQSRNASDNGSAGPMIALSQVTSQVFNTTSSVLKRFLSTSIMKPAPPAPLFISPSPLNNRLMQHHH